MTKRLLSITAKTKASDTLVDLEFKSIKEAKFFNPGLKDFEVKEFAYLELISNNENLTTTAMAEILQITKPSLLLSQGCLGENVLRDVGIKFNGLEHKFRAFSTF